MSNLKGVPIKSIVYEKTSFDRAAYLSNSFGLHSEAYAVLEKGFHRLELRYFEDCEGQVLDASLTGPDGKLLPLSQWGLFLDECL